jgi:hypothetical protein
MVRPAPVILILSLLVGGCQTAPPPKPLPRTASVTVEEEAEPWEGTATTAGRAAIDAIALRWPQALADTRRRGGTRAIAAEGALLEPQAALARAAPSPGPYRCRVFRLGIQVGRARGLGPVRSGFCYVGVEGDQLSLSSEIAGHRLGGYLYDTSASTRLIFLGAAAPARGRAPGYGGDAAKDLAGHFERVDDFRYRLVIPGAGPTELRVFELLAAPDP